MTKTCAHCGGPLDLLRSGRVPTYCSTRCRVAGNRAKAKAKAAEQLPAEMTDRPRWVSHTADKRPVQIDGRPASSTDARTWTTYEDVKDLPRRGFVLGDGIGCIDLDHCVVDGVLTDWAAKIVALNPDTFVEYSQSGTGIHIWGLLPEGPGRRIRDGRSVEIYSVGRYICLGTPVPGTPRTLRPLAV